MYIDTVIFNDDDGNHQTRHEIKYCHPRLGGSMVSHCCSFDVSLPTTQSDWDFPSKVEYMN